MAHGPAHQFKNLATEKHDRKIAARAGCSEHIDPAQVLGITDEANGARLPRLEIRVAGAIHDHIEPSTGEQDGIPAECSQQRRHRRLGRFEVREQRFGWHEHLYFARRRRALRSCGQDQGSRFHKDSIAAMAASPGAISADDLIVDGVRIPAFAERIKGIAPREQIVLGRDGMVTWRRCITKMMASFSLSSSRDINVVPYH